MWIVSNGAPESSNCPPGSSVTLLDVFKGDTAVDQMADSGATWTMGATPFLIDVVESMEKSGKRLPQLRYFLCGGAPIPEVLAAGDHAAIRRWRRQMALAKTLRNRPDLLALAPFTDEDRAFLATLGYLDEN